MNNDLSSPWHGSTFSHVENEIKKMLSELSKKANEIDKKCRYLMPLWDDIIAFEDSEIERILLASSAVNPQHNEYITKTMAAAATTIPSFRSNTIIEHFDELHYFTGLSAFPNYMFGGCTNLKSITLPESSVITDIPTQFMYISNGAFEGDITIPDSIVNIRSYAFAGLTNLQHINIPNGLKLIDIVAFSNCSNLELTELPDGIETIGGTAFQNCSKVALSKLPDNLVIDSSYGAGNSTFRNAGVTITSFPVGVTYIPNYFLEGTPSNIHYIPDRITYFGNAAFSNTNVTSVILTNTTPPTLGGNGTTWGNPNTVKIPIFVPSSVVDDYKTATNWSIWSTHIFTIEAMLASPSWTAGTYALYATVSYNGEIYYSKVNNNTAEPSDTTKWEWIDTDFPHD